MNFLQRKTSLIALSILTGWTPVMLAKNLATARSQHPAQVPTMETKSVFVMPTSPKQGRDPFFPTSNRIYEEMLAASHTNKVVEMPSLSVLGISGTPGHLLAIINNHSFAAGDSGYVLTPSGKRVRIHCVKVGSDHVTVECDGQQQRIKLRKQ